MAIVAVPPFALESSPPAKFIWTANLAWTTVQADKNVEKTSVKANFNARIFQKSRPWVHDGFNANETASQVTNIQTNFMTRWLRKMPGRKYSFHGRQRSIGENRSFKLTPGFVQGSLYGVTMVLRKSDYYSSGSSGKIDAVNSPSGQDLKWYVNGEAKTDDHDKPPSITPS